MSSKQIFPVILYISFLIVEKLDKLTSDTNRSRNELINILLDYAVENCEVR